MEIDNFLSITNRKIQEDVIDKLKNKSLTAKESTLLSEQESDSLVIGGKEVSILGNLTDEQILAKNATSVQKTDTPIINTDPIILDDDSDSDSGNNTIIGSHGDLTDNDIPDGDDHDGTITAPHGDPTDIDTLNGDEDEDNNNISGIGETNNTPETNNSENTNGETNITNNVTGYNPIIATMTDEEIYDIKAKIFAIHNTSITFNESFNSADTLFDFLSDISNGKITKDTGITKSQLTKLTQNDKWEDAHYDFFGTLNRAFSNKGANDVISYYEIRHLFYTARGEDYSVSLDEFQNNVENFAKKVQKEFQSLTDQEKLEFLINKTTEYLIAAELQDQLAALQRLLGEDIGADEITSPGEDLIEENTIKLGQIAVTDLEGNQLGGYSSWSNYSSQYEYNGVTYNTSLWYGDEDDYTYVWDENGNYVYDENIEDYILYDSSNSAHQNLERYSYSMCDMGLTIDTSYLDAEWYLGVDALVHELTHATAFIYYQEMYTINNEGEKELTYYPNDNTINKLLEMGIIDASEASILIDEPNEYDWHKLKYLMKTAWGEYTAYQADADYIDSIAGDIFDSDKVGFEMAVSGTEEKEKIENHISQIYNKGNLGDSRYYREPKPTNDWWVSYKDTDDWSAYI